jgi:cardiolipin synthase
VKIYEYEPTMIHSKTMVVDGLFSIVGSSNFDARSAEINEELDVTVYDAAFGQQMIEVFMEDLEKSRPYTLEEFRKRSLKERLSEWIALPFHSQI